MSLGISHWQNGPHKFHTVALLTPCRVFWCILWHWWTCSLCLLFFLWWILLKKWTGGPMLKRNVHVHRQKQNLRHIKVVHFEEYNIVLVLVFLFVFVCCPNQLLPANFCGPRTSTWLCFLYLLLLCSFHTRLTSSLTQCVYVCSLFVSVSLCLWERTC